MKKLFILLTFFMASITANASLITIDVEDKVYNINDTLTANIYISDINNGFQELVSAFSFDLLSPDNMLTLDRVVFGDKLNVGFLAPFASDRLVVNSAPNTVLIDELSFADSFDLLAAQDGLSKFLLVSVDFTVASLGLAHIALANVSVGDDLGVAHALSSIQNVDVRLGSQVAVPEPSSVAIFLVACLLLVGSMRLRNH